MKGILRFLDIEGVTPLEIIFVALVILLIFGLAERFQAKD